MTDEELTQVIAGCVTAPVYTTFCFPHGVVVYGCDVCTSFPQVSQEDVDRAQQQWREREGRELEDRFLDVLGPDQFRRL